MNFAVLLCAYNGEKYIKEQLESITSQTLKPSLIYIYDWGSTDRTVEIIDSFQRDNKCLCKVVKKGEPIGVAKGFKFALKEILSTPDCFDYIALCDQDDIWLKNKLSTYGKVIEYDPLVDLVFSDVSTIDSDGNTLIESRNHTSPYFTSNITYLDESVIFANPVVGMTILASNNLCRIYTNTEFKDEIMHDWALVMICNLLKLNCFYIDKPLVLYRQHSDNVLGNNSKSSRLKLLLSMQNRIKKLLNRYEDFLFSLSVDKRLSNGELVVIVCKSKIIKPIYKTVLCFFIFTNFFHKGQ